MHTLHIAVYYPLHKHLQNKVVVLCLVFANFATTEASERSQRSLSRAFFREHTGNISPPSFNHESQLVLPADDMWADAGLYSCTGPYMPIHQPVVLKKWNKVTSGKQLPAGTKCTPAAQHSHPPIRPCSHDPSSSVTQLTGPRACFNRATHSTSTTPHDVRDAWLPNIETDQYVSMTCISRKYCHASH